MLMFEEQIKITLHLARSASYETLHIQDQSLPFWVISHVRAGRVETRTGGDCHIARSGTVMVHPPQIPFSEFADRPGRHEYLFLDAAIGTGVDLLRLYPVALMVRLSNPDAWSEIFTRLVQAEPGQALTAFSLTVQLLSLILADWKAAGAVRRPAHLETPADRFVGLVHYMQEHLSEPLGRDDLAARACLHPGSLNRAFQRAYGVPPMRLLRDLRLAHARQRLETTEETLELVASRCGFDDAAYFSRAFRARYGLPPGRHRQNIRESVKSASEGYSGPLSASSLPSTIEAE